MKNQDIKTGDILNCHNPFMWYKPWRWLSLIIRAFQSLRFGKYSWASHTTIAVRDFDGKLWVYEADPKVKKTPYESWSRDMEISITRLPQELFVNNVVLNNDIYRYCESLLDKKYDFLGLFFWQPIYILTKKWYGKKDNGRYYCSEFVANILFKFFKLYPDKEQINPSKIYCDLINYEIYKGKAKNI